MKKPNVLLIMTDQQRGDCLSVAGHPELWTPNLDGWAEQGIRFSQAYEHGGFHAAIDGRFKYIWYSRTGEELLFDLENDPRETTDVSTRADYAETRSRLAAFLVRHLARRPEGFSDGSKLIAGQNHQELVPL